MYKRHRGHSYRERTTIYELYSCIVKQSSFKVSETANAILKMSLDKIYKSELLIRPRLC